MPLIEACVVSALVLHRCFGDEISSIREDTAVRPRRYNVFVIYWLAFVRDRFYGRSACGSPIWPDTLVSMSCLGRFAVVRAVVRVPAEQLVVRLCSKSPDYAPSEISLKRGQ